MFCYVCNAQDRYFRFICEACCETLGEPTGGGDICRWLTARRLESRHSPSDPVPKEFQAFISARMDTFIDIGL